MADFVAVIRRAVDGLANNTPEMRAKVYDKARGAVQRQLENMKPRPPEDMLRRQMEKLEAAIVNVESEHSEALAPPDDEIAAVPVAAVPVAAIPAEAVIPAETQAESPVFHDRDGTPEDRSEQAQIPAAVPAWNEPAEPQPAREPIPAPAVFEPVHEPAPQPVSEPAWTSAKAEPAPVFEEQRPVFREDDYEEPVPVVADERAIITHAEPVAPEAPAAAPVGYHEDEQAAAAPPAEGADQPHYGDWRDDVPAEEPLAAPTSFAEPEPGSQPQAAAISDARPGEPWEEEERPVFDTDFSAPVAGAPAAAEPVSAEPSFAPPSFVEPAEDDFPYPVRGEQQSVSAARESGWHGEAAAAAPAKPDEEWSWQAPAPNSQPDVAAAWDEVPELAPAGPVEPIDQGTKASSVDAHFDPQTHVVADTVRMPSVSDLPDLSVPAAATAAAAPAASLPSSDDPFADHHDPKPKTSAAAKPADSDPWGDLEELIGFNKDASASGGSSRGVLHADADADDLMSAPARPYRVTPVRKRNYAGILLAIVGLALVGGGGYAIWLNRDSLNDMVDGLIQSSLPTSQTAQQAPAPASQAPSNSAPASSSAANPRPANPATNQPAPANPAPTQQANTSNANPANANPPAASPPLDGSTAGTKFTQRLMPDGSELDDGPGGTVGLARNAEGQSVAQLNAPPANPAPPSTPTQAPAASAAPATPAPNGAVSPPVNAPAANPADAPALAGEKMFLYEERLGQTAPTAIDGAVSWSLQREPAANGRQEPVVQGRINIPGRGLTALMTFKRNADPSLPASHLIEIVFAVPPDFEGGAIDSVQRIAMKATEQDRGNALIAVPAKITDDFHMIALNDFPDARATNLDLLRSRNWIDIPIAYRNGRRALLTLQKGTEGERAFNEAIREWGALGATTSGQ